MKRVTFGPTTYFLGLGQVLVYINGKVQDWYLSRDDKVHPPNWYTLEGPLGDTDHGSLKEAKKAVMDYYAQEDDRERKETG